MGRMETEPAETFVMKVYADVDSVAQAKRAEVIERTEDIIEDAKRSLVEKYSEYLDQMEVIEALQDPEELVRNVKAHLREAKRDVKREALVYMNDLEARIKDSVDHFIDQLATRVLKSTAGLAEAQAREARAKATAVLNNLRGIIVRRVDQYFDELSVMEALSNPEEAADDIRETIDEGMDQFFAAHPLLARFRGTPGELKAEIEDGMAAAKTEAELLLESAVEHILDTKEAVEDAVDAKLDELKATITQLSSLPVDLSTLPVATLKTLINHEINLAVDEVKEKVISGDSIIEAEILLVVESSKAGIQKRLHDIIDEYSLTQIVDRLEEFIAMLKVDLREYVDELIDQFPAIEIGMKVLQEGEDALTVKEKLQLSKAVAKVMASQAAQN